MRFLSAGESHGKSLVGIIDDFPSGVRINLDLINGELARRQRGYGRGKRMSIEQDKIEILSGIREGVSIGSPISFLIQNQDWKNWKEIMSTNSIDETLKYVDEASKDKFGEIISNPRPGHADLSGAIKYRFDDIRNVIERSSARETAVRVAVGAFAKQLLSYFKIKIFSFVYRIGSSGFSEDLNYYDFNEDFLKEADESEVRCPDKNLTEKMKQEIDSAKENGDTLGGKFILYAKNVPIGLGSYSQWDKRFDAKIVFNIMSIQSVKAVEIGNGIRSSKNSGINSHDEIFYDKKRSFYRKTNNAGGIEGGISNGEDIIVAVYVKPIPTTMKGLHTVNLKTKENELSFKERSDICAVPAASIVGESMLAITIADLIEEKFGKDNLSEMLENFKNYKNYISCL